MDKAFTNMSRWKGPPAEVSYAVPGMSMQAFIEDPEMPAMFRYWPLKRKERTYSVLDRQ